MNAFGQETYTFANGGSLLLPYRLVNLNPTTGLLQYATTPNGTILGVLGPGGAAPGQLDVDVIVGGVAHVECSGAIVYLDFLMPSANGLAVAATMGNTSIGQSWEPSPSGLRVVRARINVNIL